MSFRVAENIDLVRSVASGLPDRDFDPYVDVRGEGDMLADGLDDDAFERDAQAVWDAANRAWVDV